MRKIVAILLMTITLLSTSPMHTESVEEYKLYSKIRIYDDSMFDAEHGVVRGSGTKDDPYIIEGWKIDASKGVGIYIRDTESYFVIRNCLIENGSRSEIPFEGIVLERVRNGRIENCIFRNNRYGIRVYESSNITIVNCAVYNSSSYIEMMEMGISEGAIEVDVSENVTIIGCKLHKNYGDGVFLAFTNHSVVRDCEACGNLVGGVSIWWSSNNLVTNCTVCNNTRGIYLVKASNNTVRGCKAYGNGHGLSILASSGNVITGCTVSGNYRGIYIDPFAANLVYNNFFNNTGKFVFRNETLSAKNWEIQGGYNFSTCKWNTSKVRGRSIAGGQYIGGNYWDDYNGADEDKDGIGDTNIPYGPGDYLPLVRVEVAEEKPSTWLQAWTVACFIPIIVMVAVIAYLLIKRRRQAVKSG
jgi:parallel beta-helix repeat protein